MIPTLITLEGYGAYMEKTSISLEGLGSVALVGDNGSGKSTLLSAIPFALFGESRTGDLDKEINNSSTKAKVSMDFSAQGQRFRVSRERTNPRKVGSQGKSTATLERLDEPNDRWELLVNGVRQVNSEVVSLIGATPDVLMSSVFASQGDAGRFTSASRPGDRRDLLFEILSLTAYARGSDRANKIRRQGEQDVANLQGKVSVLTAQEEDLEAAELEVETAAELVKKSETELAAAEQTQAESEGAVALAQLKLSEAEAGFEVAETSNKSELERLSALVTAADASACLLYTSPSPRDS